MGRNPNARIDQQDVTLNNSCTNDPQGGHFCDAVAPRREACGFTVEDDDG